MENEDQGDSSEIAGLKADLESKKGCIKCILGTVMCCYVLALIFIILFMFVKPTCKTLGSGSSASKVCVTAS